MNTSQSNKRGRAYVQGANLYTNHKGPMNIQMMSPDNLIPYDRNPRQNEEAVSKVMGSLKEYGFRQPIVVDENLVIIVGHTRLKAAQRLAFKEVPVHMAEGLTDQQKKAYRIADNRIAEEADWDKDLLRLEIEELFEQEYDLESLGFNAHEIEALLYKDKINEKESPEDFDEYDEDLETQHRCPKCGYEWSGAA